MQNFINFLDPKNALELRDWVALCSLLFTIFSFFTAQYLSARSQRITRQLAVRPYFLIARTRRNVNLSTEETGIGKGKMIATDNWKELAIANKNKKNINETIVDKLSYLKIQNLGPSYALDLKFEMTCYGNSQDEQWGVEGYMPIFNKDEYLYIPLDSPKHYPAQNTMEFKFTFRTQSNENIILHQTTHKDFSKMVIYKKLFWGLFHQKIVEFPKMNGQFRNID